MIARAPSWVGVLVLASAGEAIPRVDALIPGQIVADQASPGGNHLVERPTEVMPMVFGTGGSVLLSRTKPLAPSGLSHDRTPHRAMVDLTEFHGEA